jgi:hypothetical protein
MEPNQTAPAVEQRKNTIELTAVDSSQLRSVGHDPETNTLAIQFIGKPGEEDKVYHYYDFPAKAYEDLLAAESQGKHFYAYIKGKYDWQRIEPTTAERKSATPQETTQDTQQAA